VTLAQPVQISVEVGGELLEIVLLLDNVDLEDAS
jgi:hypothetical protein